MQCYWDWSDQAASRCFSSSSASAGAPSLKTVPVSSSSMRSTPRMRRHDFSAPRTSLNASGGIGEGRRLACDPPLLRDGPPRKPPLTLGRFQWRDRVARVSSGLASCPWDRISVQWPVTTPDRPLSASRVNDGSGRATGQCLVPATGSLMICKPPQHLPASSGNCGSRGLVRNRGKRR
jgi:hypothetical protein